MKKTFLFLYLVFLGLNAHPDYIITRGPNPGEIYFIGLTNNGEGIYYSTNYGETATCHDYGSYFYGSICADKATGILYLVVNFEQLYLSTNFGITGSWEFKNGGMAQQINSGRIEGEIFSSFSRHSENFGQTFINHTCNGYFGNSKDIDLDPIINNVGYVISSDPYVLDTLYMFVSTDKFENLQIVKKFNFIWSEAIELTRGTNSGELYLINYSRGIIMSSNDFASTWDTISELNFSNIYNLGLTGGRSEGEIYILYDFVNMAWQNAHTYIFHSTDYGKTFEVFHPFAKGNEPVLANFSSDTTEGEMPFIVDFCNFSIGDIQQYEWDFDNDGATDSYEQSPIWTYQDTGCYSVKLKVIGPDSSNTFLKEDYIYVYKTVGIDEFPQNEINCYPNPFSDQITFEFSLNKTQILK